MLNLANNYRPKCFKQVVGQDGAVHVLKNLLRKNELTSGIIFYGSHGIGKTTLARITAKSLSCLKLIDQYEPCDLCEHCQEINKDCFPDLLEFDAASHTGVDDIREIIENCVYKPQKGNYRIYIIDEVHMLSKSAFNAILKTLEEPPEHVIFLLATTEINKVPATVISRCLRLDLQHFSSEICLTLLKKVLADLGKNLEEAFLKQIAKISHGSARESLMLLEQVIACEDEAIIKRILEIEDGILALKIWDAIASGNLKQAWDLATDVLNPANLIFKLLELVDENSKEQLEKNGDLRPFLYWGQILLNAGQDLRNGFDARVVLNLTLMKMATIQTLDEETPNKKVISLTDIFMLLKEEKKMLLLAHLKENLISAVFPEVVININLARELLVELKDFLQPFGWIITIADQPSAKNSRLALLKEDPIIKRILQIFPNTKFKELEEK